MKQLIALLIVLLFLMSAVPTTAQEPLPPAPGSVGTGVPLGPAPAIGQPLPKAPEQYLPTWSAPLPTPVPTVAPAIWYVRTYAPVPVYMAPVLNSYVLTTLPTGTVVAVRWAGQDWLQLQDGYAMGSYIKDDAPIQAI